MAKVMITESYLEDIADAIRAKLGGSDTYSPGEMATAISLIDGGDDVLIVTLSWDNVNELWTPDKTVEEIQNAYTDGKEITFICQDNLNPTYWYYDDDYVFVYGVYVADEIPNQFLQKEYLYNTYGITSLGDLVLLYPNFEYPTRTYTPTEVQQVDTITYNSSDYNGIEEVSVTVNAIPSNYVGSEITRRSSNDLTASGATVSVPSGYYQSNASKVVTSGSATGPSSLSGTSATVSTGTNTVTFTKTGVTTTPTVSAGYVSSATASTATVSLTASINTRSSSDLSASNLTVTAPSGYYANAATKTLSDVNLIAGNIKKDVTIFGTTGTYEGSGGGSSMVVATATKTLTSAASSISFTGLGGEPTSFAITSSTDQTTGGTKVVAVTYDGTNLYGMDITTQAANDTGFSKSYSNGTLTITATTASFQANEYKLVYTYGGTAANIGTEEVQVGSGATSITFTGLEDEPEYFSVIFQSTFSTSSGYQRVMDVVYDGTSDYGNALDSSAKHLTSWSHSYSSGSLTVSSTGTNNGGYFHQPGYYRLIYAIGGDSSLQKKTVTPTGSDQTITADTAQGYTALSQVKVEGVTCSNLTAGNIKSGVTVKIGTTTDDDSVTSVTGTYDAGGSSKNVQVLQSTTRINSSSLTKAIGDLTVSKSGTYDIYWSGGRTNTSTSYTWGTQLYIGSTAYGSENTTWTNNVQSNHLTNVSLTENQKLSVYSRGRSGSYYTFVPMLTIVEV